MDPHHDGQLVRLRFRRSPDVQIEAIFIHAFVERIQVTEPIALHAARAPLSGAAYAAPGLHCMWRLPAQACDGGCSVRNALECPDA